jgi:hypothetical protein
VHVPVQGLHFHQLKQSLECVVPKFVTLALLLDTPLLPHELALAGNDENCALAEDGLNVPAVGSVGADG